MRLYCVAEPENCEPCTVVVEVTPALRELLAQHRTTWLDLREALNKFRLPGTAENKLFAYELFDWTPEIVMHEPADTEYGDDPDAEWCLLTHDITRTDDVPHVDCCTMFVLEGGVKWEWRLKHVDACYETPVLGWGHLED